MEKPNKNKTGEEMIVDLVNMFLPQLGISNKAKESCKNAIEELVDRNRSKPCKNIES